MITNKLPLTICILTHRSDDVFLQALRSAQIADEVLILDHASGNNWHTLEKQFKFTVLRLPAQAITDFAAIRNKALTKANTEWMLFLDSDESIPADQVAELHQLLLDQQAAAYSITRIDRFLGKQILHGEGSIRLVRLMRVAQGQFIGKVHEHAQITGTITDSNLVIFHQPHTSVSGFITKVSWYAKLAAEEREVPFWQNLLELVLYPSGKFVYNFVIKSGWQDGWAGLVYTTVMSLHSLFVRIFRYEKQWG